MRAFKTMFENTIFNNDKAVVQHHSFEYAHILIPLNKNTVFTVMVWERLFKMMTKEEYDESSLWGSD